MPSWVRHRAPARMHTVFAGEQACWHACGDEAVATWPDAEQCLAAVAQQTGAAAPMKVVLGGAQVQHLCADPALPLDDADAVGAWARHQFAHYHGAAAQGWAVAPWLEGRQRGASAVPAQALQRFTQAAAQQRIRLQAIVPWWPLALRAAWSRDALLAAVPVAVLWLVEGTRATRIELQDGELRRLDTRWLDAPEPAALSALFRDEDAPAQHWMLGYGLRAAGPLPADVRVLGGLDASAPDPAWWRARA